MTGIRKEPWLNDSSVQITSSEADGHLPLVVKSTRTQSLLEWAKERRDEIRAALPRHGAILFRGFEGTDIPSFQQLIEMLFGSLIPYTDRGTPRRRVEGRIYSSTELAPQLRVFMHNENSFAARVPRQLFFLCTRPSEQGGATPLADVRKVLARLDPGIVRRFRERQVLYVRNFGRGLGMNWKDAFQAESREELENRCREEDIEVEWIDEARLRTRQRRPALACHPETGDEAWLNHAAVLHISTVEAELRAPMLKLFAEEDLPNNSYYGDGSPIEPEVLDALRDAYERESVRFDWRAGDVLLIDNLLVAHGRDPYAGEREVVVGMTNPLSWDEIGVNHP